MFFFFNDTATTEIYTLSLHDALPISRHRRLDLGRRVEKLVAQHHTREAQDVELVADLGVGGIGERERGRSEEHTSELQSRPHLVCRLLLEKKKRETITY